MLTLTRGCGGPRRIDHRPRRWSCATRAVPRPMSRRVVGRQTTMRLRLDGRTLAPARAPHSSNGDLVLVEGVVEVAGQLSEVETAQAWDTSGGVRGPGTRKQRQDPEAFLDFGSEDLVMESVLQLPDLLTRDVPLRGRSEPNAARLQDDLSCFRIAAADEAACRDVGVGGTQGSVR